MGLKPFFIVLAAFFITVLIWKTPAHSENKIEKLDKAGLEALLSKADGRCMIVAMAAWCSPCRKELPVLVELYNRYKSKGLKIVGISLDLEGPRAMQPIIDKAKVNFPVYWVGEDPIEDFDIYAIPMLFIVQEGKVVEKIPGKRSKKYLEDKIRQLIGE
jgi:thiol-disulfide isomerase/thioredoxin